jgi:hypothetical protein
MNVKITELPLSDPLTGTEVLPIVQDGTTVKTTAQDIANLAGGGSPFSALINTPTAIVDIKNALEGISIPDGATDNYTKTIPIGMNPTTALCVLLINSLGNGCSLDFSGPLTYGVASTATVGNLGSIPSIPDPNDALSLNGKNESGLRILVNNNFLEAKRAQSRIAGFASFGEVDEDGITLPGGLNLSYTQLNNNLFGRYNGPFSGTGSIGLTSSSSNNPQDNSLLKSAYISGGNLVLLLKKISATSGETWDRLQFRVYDLS